MSLVKKKSRSRQPLLLAGIALLMFGFGFAMVPLYDVFCQVTGFGGRSIVKEAQVRRVIDEQREITVEFVANLGNHTYMDFRPEKVRIKVHPGEMEKTSFIAHNLNHDAIVTRSIYNVAPAEGSLYFHKAECFCFTEQTFEPGEERSMPLVFSVSPDLPKEIHTLALSYTIYDITQQQTQ